MRRAAALALLGLALAPGVATGAGARSPAVGGGSFNAAPLLEPGRYRDTILPNEFLYYGVRLQAGQRLRVRARIASRDWEAWTDAVGGFAINVSTPLRERLADPVAEDVLGHGNGDFGPVDAENMAGRLRWDFYGPRAVPLREAREQSDYVGPGTWYLSFNAFTRGQDRVAEFPVEFDIGVQGRAQAQPPDPTPTRTPVAPPAPAQTRAEGDGGGGPGLGAIAGLGAMGLAAGLVAGGLLGRRRR